MSVLPPFAPLSRVVLVCLLMGGVAASGHEDAPHEAPKRYGFADQYRPSPLPDRVVLTWSDDPATTVDVTYRTDAASTASVCEWIEASRIVGGHADGDVKEAARVEGSSESFKSDLGGARVHSIRLRGLKPGVKIAYRVGDGVNWSPWSHHTTARDDDAPFEFLYFGDAQNAIRALWSRVRREAHADAPRGAFALHAGDLINDADADGEWGEWHEAAGWLNATVPTVATPGNHEYASLVVGQRLSKHWRPQFSFPENGPKGLEETCYWFDYQGTRFVSLNSNERIEEQAVWLDELLNLLPKVNWTIVTFHHPIYSAAKDRDNQRLRELWKPVFDRHGVALALQGHDHTYARTGLGGPVDAPTVGTVNTPEGTSVQAGQTVYVVSVSGPKMYPLAERWEVPRAASGQQLYQVIRVEPERIGYRAYKDTGELYDAFTLDRTQGGAVRLQEQVPPTPEVLE